MGKKCLVVAVLAVAPFAALAQQAQRPATADSRAASPLLEYRSAFEGYRPYADPELARWREVNEEVGRLNGHIGHVPGSVPPRGATGSAKPPAHAGHGDRK